MYLGLGSNLGDRYQNLCDAVEKLDSVAGIQIDTISRIYETAPVGNLNQPNFLNAATGVMTTLKPVELLHTCLAIENDMGRVREEIWGPRPLDIDILFYGDEIIMEDEITIPHPRLHERAFVLVPLADIAPDLRHPALGKTIKELVSSVDMSGITLSNHTLKC